MDEAGTYAVSEDGKSFLITESTGRKTNNQILTLTKDKLVFKDDQDGMTVTAESK